jgi:hypothetical protein
MTEDIRWKQRLHNFKSALQTLVDARELEQQRPLTAFVALATSFDAMDAAPE